MNDYPAPAAHSLTQVLEERFGVLTLKFLKKSLSALNPAAPFCVRGESPLAEVLGALRRLKIGCVLVLDAAGRLEGIISERDFILKVFGREWDLERAETADFMTPRPVTGSLEMMVAHALNLMSHGGFRHIPLLDGEFRPVGILSVKDIVDCITREVLGELNLGK